MTPDELLTIITELISNKKTHPKMLTFASLRRAIPDRDDTTRDALNKLIKDGRIRIRRGINDKLIEVI